jgi:hypothetical protein
MGEIRYMRDIYEAIEKLTVVLSLRIENAVRKRGWAGKPVTERFEVNGPDRVIYPLRISLSMPLGPRVSFLPDEAPDAEQASWKIQIRRNDGVTRLIWADGLHVRKVDAGYQIFLRNQLLSEPQFKQLLDELASAGLSGHALTICKAYTSRFGAVPAEIYEILFSSQYFDQLELMHEAVLTGASELDVGTELGRLVKWPPTEK